MLDSTNSELQRPSVQTRIPVIKDINLYPHEKMQHDWNFLSELIKREIKANPDARSALVPLCRQPLSEQLPLHAVELLENNGRIKRLFERLKDLKDYLSLPAIPDEYVFPDITFSTSYVDLDTFMKSDYVEGLRKKYSEPEILAYYQSYFVGLTDAEKKMIAQRYVFARDLKILALGAELLSQNVPSNTETIRLPSGVAIHIGTDDEKIKADLLDPTNWIRRQQLKDRVYVISAGDNQYVLKERKTSRHIHTTEGGHTDSLSTEEEYHVAKDLFLRGQKQKGSVRLTWEEPLGYVKFPDGFSFVIFKHEGKFQANFKQAIVDHHDQFEAEYQAVCQLQTKYGGHDLSFDKFAELKMNLAYVQACYLYDQTLVELGYINNDEDRFNLFRINIIDEKPYFELVGLDLERFQKAPKDSDGNKHRYGLDHHLISPSLLNRDGMGSLLINEGWIAEDNPEAQSWYKTHKERNEKNLAQQQSVIRTIINYFRKS